jgi:fermentation-respiration switch protein FrsA (DUF1100 family)
LLAPVALAISFATLVAVVSDRTIRPSWYEHRRPQMGLRPWGQDVRFGRDPLADLGLPYSDVSFPTHEDATLRGWLIPAPPAPPGTAPSSLAVVAAHGRAGDRRDLLSQAETFHGLGASVLLFDFRDHGVSDGASRGMSLGYREAQDISAAVRYLKEVHGYRRVVVVGESLGASSAILAAAEDGAIDAVIAESPIAEFETFIRSAGWQSILRISLLGRLPAPPLWWARTVRAFTLHRVGAESLREPVDVVERIAPRPLLIVHGAADDVVDPAHAERLYARAGGPKSLWIVPGATHTGASRLQPEAYRAHVSALLQQLAP